MRNYIKKYVCDAFFFIFFTTHPQSVNKGTTTKSLKMTYKSRVLLQYITACLEIQLFLAFIFVMVTMLYYKILGCMSFIFFQMLKLMFQLTMKSRLLFALRRQRRLQKHLYVFNDKSDITFGFGFFVGRVCRDNKNLKVKHRFSLPSHI